jgi:Zn-dependent alcohol dehydrogenase
MKAAVCREIGQVAIEELDEPSPGHGEMKLQMVATGVCRTDLSIFQGHLPSPFPIVLGHEGCGIVEEVGPGVEGIAPGDHVVCTIVAGCGHCFQCLREASGLCEDVVFYTGKMLDGTTRLSKGGEPIQSLSYQASFAERAIVPQRCAVRVRPDAPLEKLAGLACGVSTGLGAAMVRAPVEPGATVLAIGAGGVGLSALMGARLRGAARLIAVDVVASKLEKARELGLATETIDASREDIVEIVRELTQGRGVDQIFDAVGANGTLEQGLECLRPGGRAVVIGHAAGLVEAKVDTTHLLRQKSVTGTMGGSIEPRRHIPEFVELYLAGRLDLDGLMDADYLLEELGRAFEDLEQGRITRGVVRFPAA